MGNISFLRQWPTARLMMLTALMAVAMPKAVAQTEQDETVVRTLSDNDQRRYRYFYLEALLQQEREHFAAAFDLFRHALEINPNAPEVHYELAGFYFMLKQPEKALACYEKAVALDPTNNNYLEYLGQMLINRKDYARAITVYERLYKGNKSRTDILQLLYQLYGEEGQYDQMLDVIDRMERIEGVSAQTALTRMQIYDMQGESEKSKRVLIDLVEKNPYDSSYKLMLGNWLLQNGHTKEAYKVCQGVLAEEPHNVSARMLLLDYYQATHRKEKRQTLLRQLLRDKDTPQESRYALILQATRQLKDENTDQIMAIFDDALSVPQEDAGIYLIKAMVMVRHDFPRDEVNAVYRQALAVEPDNEMAQGLLVQNLAEEERFGEIVDLCKTSLQYTPDNQQLCYFEGFSLFQLKRNDEALASLRKAVELRDEESDSGMMADCYSLMGEIYREKGMDKACYEAYDSCLHYAPDNVGTLNNYAYYLSLDSAADLQKAEQMSLKAVQKEPDNATFLDTYAWILFKEKRYDDAKTIAERAIASDSTLSSVVVEHCGDIFYMAGDTDRAMEMWQKAAQEGKDNAILRRKIELKQYIEE